MNERPILFKDEMIQAIIRRLKTQTRRVIKPQPDPSKYTTLEGVFDQRYTLIWTEMTDIEKLSASLNQVREAKRIAYCPYGMPGDRLWVREAWQKCEECGEINYRASLREFHCGDCDGPLGNWKPSIHMFRSYSRIDLEIVNIWSERVQDISANDAIQEGIDSRPHKHGMFYEDTAIEEFADLWNSINAKPKLFKSDPWGKREKCYISYPWGNVREIREHRGLTWYVMGNPRVWAVEFEIEEE